jgi:hypothetical protein
MAHPRHQEVRHRYQQQCGYCGVAEVDAGAEHTVDHFHPISAGGDDSDDNLVYACFRCNLYKGDFLPTAEDVSQGRRVLHPLLDNASLHFQENPSTGLLEPLTETGRFHLLLLRLNRPQLVDHRLQRRLINLLVETQQLQNEEIESLRQQIAVLENYLRFLTNAEGPEQEENSMTE